LAIFCQSVVDVMPNLVALGIGGLEAEPGDHICEVFSSEAQRDRVLIPFLQAGLASGDKCISVIDGTPPGEIVAALGPAGQAAALTVGKQLEVYGASDLLLRSGGFSADEVIGAWKAAISDVLLGVGAKSLDSQRYLPQATPGPAAKGAPATASTGAGSAA
jgi:MEDS: MEthanogen/methylotroph, DcmR Sensory domain